jgi:hypothetical protein
MSATLTIDTIQSPIDGDVASANGRYESDSSVSSIAVVWRDRQGTTVTAAATFTGGFWSVANVDVSTLHTGEVLAMVTLTATSDAAFDAATTINNAAYPHVTGTPWATHLNVRRSYDQIPISDDDMDEACWVASDMLFRYTGSRWPGICHVDKLRPQAAWRANEHPRYWQSVNGMPYARYGYCSCNRGRDVGCSSLPEIRLPFGPVHADSTVVMIDGNRFDGWTVRDGRMLVRIDGDGWPCCQRTELPDTERGTWSVSFSYGSGPDGGGVYAAAMLGYELALAYAGNDHCRLPRRIRQLTRGGTTIALLDPMTLFKEGLTGITEVDLWTQSVMVGNRLRPATVSVPGKGKRFRREG